MANLGPEKRIRIVKPEKNPVPQRVDDPREPQKVPQEQPAQVPHGTAFNFANYVRLPAVGAYTVVLKFVVPKHA